jgi:hypothetical protein
MGLLGRRVGELHRALCITSGDPHFDPEPITDSDYNGWKSAIAEEVDTTFGVLKEAMPGMADDVRASVAPLLDLRERILDRVRNARCDLKGLVKTRYHGDLHLGQVLVALDDFIIVDFEGEPGRTLEERRAKGSVMRTPYRAGKPAPHPPNPRRRRWPSGSATPSTFSSRVTRRPPRASRRCRPMPRRCAHCWTCSSSRKRSTSCVTRLPTDPTGSPFPFAGCWS